VVADMVSVIGTTGTGFLQNDACWRSLERLPPGELRSPFYLHIEVDDRPGVLAHVAERLAAEGVSIARLTQRQLPEGASLDVVTHDASTGRVHEAAGAIAQLPEVHGAPDVMRVVSERGV
jgi:homoserine dehydrogenase